VKVRAGISIVGSVSSLWLDLIPKKIEITRAMIATLTRNFIVVSPYMDNIRKVSRK